MKTWRTVVGMVAGGLAVAALGAGGAWAGGGVNPGGVKAISGPTITAVIFMDPHMDGVTPTAKEATVWLRSGTLNSQASFKIPADFALFLGCDLSLTAQRFVYSPAAPNRLTTWVPPFDVQSLFLPLGIVVSDGFVPAIVEVNHHECLVAQSGQTDSVPGPGWLYMQATIQFLVPPKK